MNDYKTRLAHYNDTEWREPRAGLSVGCETHSMLAGTPKDLDFIRSVVKEWPEDALNVRLDFDGEICFMSRQDYDFYPEDIEAAKDSFIARKGMTSVGTRYTREQWGMCQSYWRSIARLTLLSWYIPLLVLVAVALWLSVLPGLAAGAILGGLLIMAVNNVEEALGDDY